MAARVISMPIRLPGGLVLCGGQIQTEADASRKRSLEDATLPDAKRAREEEIDSWFKVDEPDKDDEWDDLFNDEDEPEAESEAQAPESPSEAMVSQQPLTPSTLLNAQQDEEDTLASDLWAELEKYDGSETADDSVSLDAPQQDEDSLAENPWAEFENQLNLEIADDSVSQQLPSDMEVSPGSPEQEEPHDYEDEERCEDTSQNTGTSQGSPRPSSQPSEEAPKKRGRGRPRKNAPPVAPKEKKARGRPRKKPSPATTAATTPASTPASRSKKQSTWNPNDGPLPIHHINSAPNPKYRKPVEQVPMQLIFPNFSNKVITVDKGQFCKLSPTFKRLLNQVSSAETETETHDFESPLSATNAKNLWHPEIWLALNHFLLHATIPEPPANLKLRRLTSEDPNFLYGYYMEIFTLSYNLHIQNGKLKTIFVDYVRPTFYRVDVEAESVIKDFAQRMFDEANRIYKATPGSHTFDFARDGNFAKNTTQLASGARIAVKA